MCSEFGNMFKFNKLESCQVCKIKVKCDKQCKKLPF